MNYLAILGAVVASMVLGYLWYGPLFGKAWMRGMGWDPNDQALKDSMKKGAGPGYVAMIIGSILTAGVLSYLLGHLTMPSNLTGLCLGLLGWLGFILPLRLGDKMFEKKNTGVVMISLGYQLVNLAIMGAIIGHWK